MSTAKRKFQVDLHVPLGTVKEMPSWWFLFVRMMKKSDADAMRMGRKPGCVFLRPSTILNRRNPDERRDEQCQQDAKLPRHTAIDLPQQPKMMRFPTAAATRAAAFVATRSTNNPAASSALRFSALRAMSAAAPGPKVRQFSSSPKRGPNAVQLQSDGQYRLFLHFYLQSSMDVRFERIGSFQGNSQKQHKICFR